MKSTLGIPSKALVTHHDPRAASSEAFRVLRTNLQFMGLDKPLKSIIVTSAAPTEGKSTVSSNLATAFAQTGANVCLIDADMRRPTLHKVLGLDNWTGLSRAVITQNGLETTIRPTEIPGLSVLTSGPIPPNPAELLGSARMVNLLRELEERFDMVIVDTPPVLAVTDACVLAPSVGGVVLVARSGQTDRRQLVRAKESLLAVKANLLGVVLHGIPQERREGYYYYYYGSQDGERSSRRG
jgi:capsular exopolysaccharide synthesis family protein